MSHLIHASLNAIFLSLFAALLLVYLAAEEHIAWQICNALSGYIHLVGGGHIAFDTWRQKSDILRSYTTSAIGLGTAAVSFQAAAGYLTREGPLIFMLATLWILGVTVIAFVSLLVSASRPIMDSGD